MSFAYTVSVNDPANSPLDGALAANVAAAAARWSSYLGGLGSIDIKVTVGTIALGLAEGGPATTVFVGTDRGRNVYEAGTITELRTGRDANGATADLNITVNSDALKAMWLDAGSPPPADRTDGLTVFTHEIGHGLGIVGYRNSDTGALSTAESTWDKDTVLNADGTASFLGPTAQAVYEGPVSVTTLKNGEQYYHLANIRTERDAQDVMNGLGLPPGTRHAISDLDLAILKDLGATVTAVVGDYPTAVVSAGPGLNSVFRFYDTVTNDHFYTTDPAEKASIRTNLKTFTYESVPWATPDKGAGTTDVFRFYDSVTKTHFLTSDAGERDTVLKTLPTFTYEGVAFEAYATAGGDGTFALERFFNTTSKVHTYAADPAEVALIKSGAVGQGWVDEGASFVVHHAGGNVLLV